MTTMNRQQPGDPAWLVEALRLDGLREVPGKDHNPEVVKLFAEAGHPNVTDDETAWCAAFVGAMLRRAGYLSTGTLLARDYLKFGQKVTAPKRGDIVVFPRGNSSWQGHVAFVASVDKTYVYAFGGNQNNAVNVTRYSRGKALGFRRPVAQRIVLDIQERLHALGYGKTVGEIDGVLGPKTRAGIAAYEIAKGFAPFPDLVSLQKHLAVATRPAQTEQPRPAPVPAPEPVRPRHEAPIEEYEEALAPRDQKRRRFPWPVVLALLAVAALAAFGLWPTGE